VFLLWKTAGNEKHKNTTEETEAKGFYSFRWSFSVSKKNCLPKSLIQATGNLLLDNNTSIGGKYKKGERRETFTYSSWKWKCASITQNSGVSTWRILLTPKWCSFESGQIMENGKSRHAYTSQYKRYVLNPHRPLMETRAPAYNYWMQQKWQ